MDGRYEMNLGTNLTELEKLAKAVTYPYKDDWELKQALVKFDRAANPETILALIALLKQQHEALEESWALCENYLAVEDTDGYRFTEAPAVIRQAKEALTTYDQMMKGK